eukprot:CAMPEP_0197828526 /NCGR_PEP_ID=MMETSP1437-20131217/5071_1 /TAXON_ID=49252 ORGANISM="Eucampia antarctica, Strain CCMP1452" /NCGR_SAMPLE_ID=MMETSP1437 /ASSEMBLY_ACC=CAM_ASM_001096 /LENGTH=373 /DNA_ID=CAMNT_0043429761 /DNA_START=38 /DNA_END=1159 /DNA_ORIENTATION=+
MTMIMTTPSSRPKSSGLISMKGLSVIILCACVRISAAFLPSTVPVQIVGPKVPASRERGQVVALQASSLGNSVVLGAAAFAVSRTVQVVRQGDVSIVERFGKFHNRLEPGLHILIPFVDQVRATLTNREQVLDIPPQKCITSDNAPLSADAVVYWRIVNAERAVYAVVDLQLAIQNLVLTQLRSEIGKLTLDMTFSAREQVNKVLLDELDVATEPWGVKITRVEVRDIIPNQEILRAMEMQMAAERTKRASIIKSEGERERSINEAEGSARSRIIDAQAAAKSVVMEADAEASKIEKEAQGVARALAAISEAVGGNEAKADAVKFQLMREYIATQRDLATSNNAKVIVTSSSGYAPADDVFAKAIAFYNGASE